MNASFGDRSVSYARRFTGASRGHRLADGRCRSPCCLLSFAPHSGASRSAALSALVALSHRPVERGRTASMGLRRCCAPAW